ncbi:MAG TPA: hypothetical protein VE907_13420 [Gammaproteobacteria bacterium]|nr:hypothetical protein [Gammaproteobacteria bacterium]
MLKLIVAVLAVALAGTASAAGWRSLRVDGTSQASFEKSMAAFEEKLSPARRQVFVLALHDIWNEGAKAAEANQGEYTADEYLRQVDGLGYNEIVTLTDPTGDTAQARYQEAWRYARLAPHPAPSNPSAGYVSMPRSIARPAERPMVGADGLTMVERWTARQ